MSEPDFRRMVQHIMGEIAAQQMRQGGGEQPVQDQVPANTGQEQPLGSNPTNALGNIVPSRIQGGQQVPTGMEQGPA